MRVHKQLAIVAITIGVGLGYPGFWLAKAQEEVSGLFFSEYIEGSSNNKALEIYNPTGNSVEMNTLKLEKYMNGEMVAANVSLPVYTLEPNKVFVVCHSSAVQTIKNVCNYQTASLNFNGNDAMVLKNANGEILDVIGQIGNDPGDAWGSGDAMTKDRTLVRKCSINNGDTVGSDVFDPAMEWTGMAIDTFTNLGTHTTCYPPTVTPTLTPTPEIVPTEIPTPTLTSGPTLTPMPTETAEPTPTPTVEPTPTMMPTSTPTPTPTLEPTPTPTASTTLSPSPTVRPTPTPTPTQQKYGWKHWTCENRVLRMWWGRKFKEVTIPVCHWQWRWWDFRFSPLHKHP